MKAKTELVKLDSLKSLDDCIDMARQVGTLHRSTKQLLLSKICSMPEVKSYKGGSGENHPVLRNPALKMLISDARANLDIEYTNN